MKRKAKNTRNVIILFRLPLADSACQTVNIHFLGEKKKNKAGQMLFSLPCILGKGAPPPNPAAVAVF